MKFSANSCTFEEKSWYTHTHTHTIEHSQLQRSALPYLMCVQWSEVSSTPVEEPQRVFWRNAVDYNVIFK